MSCRRCRADACSTGCLFDERHVESTAAPVRAGGMEVEVTVDVVPRQHDAEITQLRQHEVLRRRSAGCDNDPERRRHVAAERRNDGLRSRRHVVEYVRTVGRRRRRCARRRGHGHAGEREALRRVDGSADDARSQLRRIRRRFDRRRRSGCAGLQVERLDRRYGPRKRATGECSRFTNSRRLLGPTRSILAFRRIRIPRISIPGMTTRVRRAVPLRILRRFATSQG